MLLIGGIVLHLVVCGALMVTADHTTAPSTNYQEVSTDDSSSPARKTDFPSYFKTVWRYIIKNLDLELFRSGRYWSVAVMTSCTIFSYTMWIVYFVSQAQSNGFSLEEAGTFVTIAGGANLLAKVSQGPITDRGLMSSWGLTAICMTISSVFYCASPWMTSYWTMMTSAFLILFADGVLSCQNDVIIKQVLGEDLLAGAFGWIAMKTTILTLALGFLPGRFLMAT